MCRQRGWGRRRQTRKMVAMRALSLNVDRCNAEPEMQFGHSHPCPCHLSSNPLSRHIPPHPSPCCCCCLAGRCCRPSHHSPPPFPLLLPLLPPTGRCCIPARRPPVRPRPPTRTAECNWKAVGGEGVERLREAGWRRHWLGRAFSQTHKHPHTHTPLVKLVLMKPKRSNAPTHPTTHTHTHTRTLNAPVAASSPTMVPSRSLTCRPVGG